MYLAQRPTNHKFSAARPDITAPLVLTKGACKKTHISAGRACVGSA